MKVIINGRKYDTNTAKEIGSYWNGLSVTDFRTLSEKLYRKRTGEFFLYGEGGAMTKYATNCGDTLCDGKDIIPLAEDEAKAWCENYLSVDEYEEVFGEVKE